jgi:lipopolysaccharide transport system permease protein
MSGDDVVVVDPPAGFFRIDLRSLWEYRELLYFLVWRDLKLRYKQTAIGIGWVVLQPLATMVIFSVIFGRLARVPSDGLPYPVFVYSALLPWNYFATALNRCILSVVGEAHLISKIYFPRLLLPLAAPISGLVDFAVSLLLLLGMLAWYHLQLSWAIVTLPLFLLVAFLAALAVGLWLSALNVRYRDVAYTIPLLIQIWLFASPVVYPLSLVPEKYRLLYSLNPMVGVVEGFRWALLGKTRPDFGVFTASLTVVAIILIGGLAFFRHMEDEFADVV